MACRPHYICDEIYYNNNEKKNMLSLFSLQSIMYANLLNISINTYRKIITLTGSVQVKQINCVQCASVIHQEVYSSFVLSKRHHLKL
jgi:hypothetical protein